MNNSDCVTQIANNIVQSLTKYEDVESAIAAYKELSSYIDKLKELQEIARSLAENCLRQTGETKVKTEIGSAGWTQPKKRKLDNEAWKNAMLQDEKLLKLQADYDVSRARLERAQSKYSKLPKGDFYIK